MQITRKLVEQNDQRQSAARRLGPVIQRARFRVTQRVGEARARGVEVGVLLEPDLAMRRRVAGKPVVEHFIIGHVRARSRSRTEWMASRPPRSRIWCRHDVPSATMMSSVAALRTAGS